MVGSWQSSVNGPIPPHPMYDERGRDVYCVTPALRVKGEGQRIAQRGHKGCVVNLMNDANIDGGLTPRPKKSSKDHIKENVKRMRQIQRSAHQRTESTEQDNAPKPVKALWKSEKFATVPSKVATALQPGNQTPRPASRDFLRAHSRSGPSRPGSRGTSPVPRLSTSDSADQISVTTAADARTVTMARNDFDFIKINGINARHSAMKRCPSDSALYDVKQRKEDEFRGYRRGVVPQYLQDRRRQWADDAAATKAAAPHPDCPPGHRTMPEKERKETLDMLRTRYRELVRALQDIPLTSDTLRTKNKRHETEKQLEEVEEAVRIFNRPRVFVKIDQ